MGEETEVKVSEAILAIDYKTHLNWGGKANIPNLHPPAPAHFEMPEFMIVPSG